MEDFGFFPEAHPFNSCSYKETCPSKAGVSQAADPIRLLSTSTSHPHQVPEIDASQFITLVSVPILSHWLSNWPTHSTPPSLFPMFQLEQSFNMEIWSCCVPLENISIAFKKNSEILSMFYKVPCDLLFAYFLDFFLALSL